ncbi:Uma2 family endonuclease [Hymenobacter psoromatis]|uniref:Uma2 family endonuclease n=1 Tax=Hymenobacter psoromatis TaxID=1484116 RepID=UPI001CBF6848|nr:Uma2 family endonuclease [Hymenobacter psoromatis]
MSAVPQFALPSVSPEEYLAAERAASFKSEYYQGQVYAMAGASYAHNLVNLNTATALNLALRERDCTVQVSDQRLQVKDNGLYTYPDLSVVCGPPQFAPDKYLDTLLNPVVLAEVVSLSTGEYDRVGKFILYKDIPTLRHYLLLESTQPIVRLATWREPKVWAFDTFEGLTAVVPLPAIGVELTLADLYRKVPLAG